MPAIASAADSRTLFGVDPEAGQLTAGDLAWMDAGHVGSVRFVLNWQEVQPTAGAPFNWSRTDQEVEALALHKIVPLPQLFGDPSLVTQTGNAAVMNRWLFFVAAAVNRYKAGSPFWQRFKADHPNATPQPPPVWQVYNEQNIPEFWPGGPSPNKYAVLLHVSAQAIRGSDPTAKILLGGMHGEDGMNGIPSWTFLKNLYEYPGAAADFDYVAIHPYDADVAGIAREVGMVRNVMNSKGDQQAQIWITEMGWSSQLDPANTWWWEQTLEGQAKMLDSAWKMLLYAKSSWNIGGIYWYTWRDPTTDVCNFCNSAGLLDKNYAPKPSYGAFRELAASSTKPPETTITSGPAGPTNDKTPTFKFSSDKSGSTYECKVDGGSFRSCNSPSDLASLADGGHSFAVRATDSFGNTDPTPAERSFNVDTANPETTIDSGPSGWTNDSTPTFNFSSSEPASTYDCKIDSGAFSSCNSSMTLAPLSDGDHTFSVRATDPAANADQTPATRSFKVDTTPPVVSLSCPPAPATSNTSPVRCSGSWNDPGGGNASGIPFGGVIYALDTDPGAATTFRGNFYSGPLNVSGNGTWDVVLLAVDRAGNVSNFSVVQVKIDAG